MNDHRKRKLDGMRGGLKARSQSSHDIGDLWEEQSQQEQRSEKNRQEYLEAKKKLKSARKEVYKEFITTDITENKTIAYVKKLYKSALEGTKAAKKYALEKKLRAVKIGVFAVVLLLGFTVFTRDTSPDPISTLGESTSTQVPDLPRQDSSSTAFDLLYRPEIDPNEYDVALVSPTGSDPAYTYLDRFTEDGVIFRVTQQEIPPGFDLAETAQDFQATNVIQVNEERIYHGYSEKGGIQSLIFIKNDLLISIRSPQKFTDEQWASYYLSLE